MDFKIDLLTWIITGLIAVVTFYISRFYLSLKNYPPGPVPIPILGNILMLKGTTRHPALSFMDLRRKYGEKLYTFWMGNWPVVFIFDYDLAKEAFNKGVFTGRPQTIISQILKGSDVILADFTPTWESLRKVAHSAVRKYAVSERLPVLISDIVDEIMQIIITKEDGKMFNPKPYMNLILSNTLGSIGFGKKYSIDDAEFKYMKSLNDRRYALGDKTAIVDLIPILRFPLANVVNEMTITTHDWISLMRRKFDEHLSSYKHGIIRDFADALIAAKEEAIKENKSSAAHLTDANLNLTLLDLFIAGSETTDFTLQWALLLMANYPEIQIKLRNEISSRIGDRIPIQDDKKNCHYVNAFINEVLRFVNVAPIGIFHKTVENSEIGGYKIAKDCIVLVHQYAILNDPKHWSDPELFKPERFLDLNENFSVNKNGAFIPFGIGRRSCPGERLALADLFLIMVRMIQQTDGYLFVLPNGERSADLSPDPNSLPVLFTQNDYQIILKKQYQ